MAQVKVGDATLEVQADEDGEKAPLILVHALGADMSMWDQVVPALAAQFRLIRYDVRGHGRSSAEGAPYSLDLLGRDALAVLDALGIERASVLGASMGGAVAQWLLVHAPERIERAVIANSAARLGSPDVWNERIRSVLAGGMAASVGPTMQRWFSEDFAQSHPDIVEAVGAVFGATPAQGYAGAAAALRDLDLRQSLHGVEHPVLVITGDNDSAVSEEDTATLLASVPQAKHVKLPAHHMACIETADAFGEAVVKFLTSKQGAGRPTSRSRAPASARAPARTPRGGARRQVARPAAAARAPVSKAAGRMPAKAAAAKSSATKSGKSARAAKAAPARKEPKPAGRTASTSASRNTGRATARSAGAGARTQQRKLGTKASARATPATARRTSKAETAAPARKSAGKTAPVVGSKRAGAKASVAAAPRTASRARTSPAQGKVSARNSSSGAKPAAPKQKASRSAAAKSAVPARMPSEAKAVKTAAAKPSKGRPTIAKERPAATKRAISIRGKVPPRTPRGRSKS